MKIGFYDSGLGGMLILKAVATLLPEYDYEYYGDTANLPLGDKTEDEIHTYTQAGIKHLFAKECSLVIIACNTASSETLRKLQDGFLQQQYPERKVLGVIIPAVEELVDSKSRQALLLATKRTVDSGKYQKELSVRTKSSTKLLARSTPELVPLIESGKVTDAVALAKAYIEQTIESAGEVDTVILGCTHYAKLKNELRDAYGQKIRFLAQDEFLPNKVQKYLQKHTELESTLSKNGTRNIFLTEHREEYDKLLQELLGGRLLKE